MFYYDRHLQDLQVCFFYAIFCTVCKVITARSPWIIWVLSFVFYFLYFYLFICTRLFVPVFSRRNESYSFSLLNLLSVVPSFFFAFYRDNVSVSCRPACFNALRLAFLTYTYSEEKRRTKFYFLAFPLLSRPFLAHTRYLMMICKAVLWCDSREVETLGFGFN